MRLNWSRLVSAFLCLTLSLSGEEPVGRKQVSYNTFKVRKAFFVPKAPQWGTIDDFDIFYNGKKAVPGKRPARTVCRLSRTETDLLLHITAFEPLKIRDNNKTDFHNLWRGDLFEIFFGGMEPEPWCMQFVAGAGGGRFSDTLPLEKWQAKAKVGKGKYELHIRIPLAALKVHNGGIGFNISRQRYRELSVWAMVHYGFHEPENFGELLLDDYAAIFEQRFGVSGRHIKSREDFERETVKRSIPVTDIQYGPRLLYPGPDAMTVAWESAGKTFGIIEYRKAGEKKFNISAAGTVNGVPVAAACHRAALTGLEPDSVYEYQVANLHPVTRQKKVSKLYRFRTFPARAKDFTGVFFCDAHGGFENLKRLFKNPDIARADFVCNLGDMHSMMTGMDAVQHGYLDVQTKFLAGSAMFERPLIITRFADHSIS